MGEVGSVVEKVSVSLCLSRSLWFHPATICTLRLDESALGVRILALKPIRRAPVNYRLTSECCFILMSSYTAFRRWGFCLYVLLDLIQSRRRSARTPTAVDHRPSFVDLIVFLTSAEV
jgi:hypothetical protein